jgi:hypothetical protein
MQTYGMYAVMLRLSVAKFLGVSL